MEAIQITLPSSKSLSNRWLVLDYLSRNGIKIKNLSTAEDTQLFKRLLRQLKMNRRHNFDCHDAGTVARFLVGLCAVTPGTHNITGSERLCQRPMAPLFEALRSIGCQIKCTGQEGYLPVSVTGITPALGTRVIVDCSQSSQFASAMLFTAACAAHGMAVELKNVGPSEPYIAMTLSTLERAGVNFVLKGNPPAYFVEHNIPNCDAITIEKDWSAASYFYAIAALKPSVLMHMSGLTLPSTQGDCVVHEIFSHLGVISEIVGQAIEIEGTEETETELVHDFSLTPDLVPTVAVCCAALGIEARLTGVANLKLKESDRIAALTTELRKMGCQIETLENEIHILPSEIEITQPVETYGDHRIAMAFATLKVLFPDIELTNSDVVSKSFPQFIEMLDRACDAEPYDYDAEEDGETE